MVQWEHKEQCLKSCHRCLVITMVCSCLPFCDTIYACCLKASSRTCCPRAEWFAMQLLLQMLEVMPNQQMLGPWWKHVTTSCRFRLRTLCILFMMKLVYMICSFVPNKTRQCAPIIVVVVMYDSCIQVRGLMEHPHRIGAFMGHGRVFLL